MYSRGSPFTFAGWKKNWPVIPPDNCLNFKILWGRTPHPHTDTIFYFKVWICFLIKIYYIWQISSFHNSPIHVILKQCTVNSEVTHNSVCFVCSEITSWTAANLYSTQDTTVNISQFWNHRICVHVILIAHFENVFF